MSLKISGIAALAAAAVLGVLLAPQTVGYASSGVVALASEDANTNVDKAPVRLDIPAGWQQVPASSSGALVALRCAAAGCIPGATARLSCVSAEGSHDGASGELAALANMRPEIRGDALTSEAAVVAVGGREFHELSTVLDNGRYVLTAATRIGGDLCGLGVSGPRGEGARLDLTIRSMLSRLRFS